MSAPLISVLMPVYNAEEYLKDAIESILNQSYTNFEFIIIDDGSTDRSKAIVESYSDPRIVFVHCAENKGIVYQLNYGINLAKGEYLVRMDADDIAFKKRIELQYDFLKKNPSYSIVGAQAMLINSIGEKVGITTDLPIESEAIKVFSLFFCPFVHPTVLIKTEVLKKHPYQKVAAEDYYLWIQILQKYKAKNLEIPLLYYREHNNNSTKLRSIEFLKSLDTIYASAFNHIGFKLSLENLQLLNAMNGFSQKKLTSLQFKQLDEFLNKLMKWNTKNNSFTKKTMYAIFQKVWYLACYKNKTNGLSALYSFYTSNYGRSQIFTKKHLAFIMQCLSEISILEKPRHHLKKIYHKYLNA